MICSQPIHINRFLHICHQHMPFIGCFVTFGKIFFQNYSIILNYFLSTFSALLDNLVDFIRKVPKTVILAKITIFRYFEPNSDKIRIILRKGFCNLFTLIVPRKKNFMRSFIKIVRAVCEINLFIN